MDEFSFGQGDSVPGSGGYPGCYQARPDSTWSLTYCLPLS